MTPGKLATSASIHFNIDRLFALTKTQCADNTLMIMSGGSRSGSDSTKSEGKQ